MPWLLENSFFDEPSSSAADNSCSLRARFDGSRGSSWQRWPILRFIHRVHGRSYLWIGSANSYCFQACSGKVSATMQVRVKRGSYRVAGHMLSDITKYLRSAYHPPRALCRQDADSHYAGGPHAKKSSIKQGASRCLPIADSRRKLRKKFS